MITAYEKKYLTEIQLSIHEIEAVLGTGYNLKEMDGNVPLIQAIAEELNIIGEAVVQIKLMKHHSLASLVHLVEVSKGIEEDNGRVTLDDIRSVLINDLPPLKVEVHKLLMED